VRGAGVDIEIASTGSRRVGHAPPVVISVPSMSKDRQALAGHH
jgi:hypothetical protein